MNVVDQHNTYKALGLTSREMASDGDYLHDFGPSLV